MALQFFKKRTAHSSQLNPAGVRFQHHFYKTAMTGKPSLVKPSIVFKRDIHPTPAFPSSIFNSSALQLERSLRKGGKKGAENHDAHIGL